MTATSLEDTPITGTRPAILFPIGIPLYLLSFALPAISIDAGSPMIGWQVALTTLQFPHPLFLLPGLTNPIVVLYALLRIAGCAPFARRILGLAALALIPVSWVTMNLFHCGVQIGHIAWVAGIAFLCAGEIRDWLKCD